jgi:hypothetical protein
MMGGGNNKQTITSSKEPLLTSLEMKDKMGGTPKL